MWVPGAPSPKQEGEAPQNTSVSTVRAPIYLPAQHPRDGWLFRVLGGGLGCTRQRRVMRGGRCAAAAHPETGQLAYPGGSPQPQQPGHLWGARAVTISPPPQVPRAPQHPRDTRYLWYLKQLSTPYPRSPGRTWGAAGMGVADPTRRGTAGGPGAPRGRRSRIRSKPVKRRRRGRRRRRGALGKCSHPPCAGRRGDYKPHSAAGRRKRREEAEEKEEKPGRLRGQSQGGRTWLCD